MTTPNILIIEDDPDGRRSVCEALEDIGFTVTTAQTGNDGVARFRGGAFDVVLTDLVLPDIDGIEVLTQIRAGDAAVPVLIMTAYGSVSSAVDALKAGAYDYITKPLDLDDIQSKVRRAAETHSLRGEVTQLRRAAHARYSAAAIVAESPGMRDVLQRVEALRDTNATVLIVGESGTGKELVARALHVDSRRSEAAFVAVNCGAFADTLLDSELFGHEKGSFTGATRQRQGAFERAAGGTLFLDEIGDAPAAVQVKLLRVLEEREFFRLGGQVPVKVDVRVLSASNRDLEAMVESGSFREDLYYRLKVVTLRIPPLRERPEDIRPLADRFIAAACKEHGRTIATVDHTYYETLERAEWPGNVRQLRNCVESSVIMAQGQTLAAADVDPGDKAPPPDGGVVVPADMSFADIEREILLQTLRRCDGNRTLAAEKLGLSRRTIQRKVQELDLPF